MNRQLVGSRRSNSYSSIEVDLCDMRSCSINCQDVEPDGVSPIGKTLRLMI